MKAGHTCQVLATDGDDGTYLFRTTVMRRKPLESPRDPNRSLFAAQRAKLLIYVAYDTSDVSEKPVFEPGIVPERVECPSRYLEAITVRGGDQSTARSRLR